MSQPLGIDGESSVSDNKSEVAIYTSLRLKLPSHEINSDFLDLFEVWLKDMDYISFYLGGNSYWSQEEEDLD